MPISTGQRIRETLELEARARDNGAAYEVVSNPEFLRAGTAGRGATWWRCGPTPPSTTALLTTAALLVTTALLTTAPLLRAATIPVTSTIGCSATVACRCWPARRTSPMWLWTRCTGDAAWRAGC